MYGGVSIAINVLSSLINVSCALLHHARSTSVVLKSRSSKQISLFLALLAVFLPENSAQGQMNPVQTGHLRAHLQPNLPTVSNNLNPFMPPGGAPIPVYSIVFAPKWVFQTAPYTVLLT